MVTAAGWRLLAVLATAEALRRALGPGSHWKAWGQARALLGCELDSMMIADALDSAGE